VTYTDRQSSIPHGPISLPHSSSMLDDATRLGSSIHKTIHPTILYAVRVPGTTPSVGEISNLEIRARPINCLQVLIEGNTEVDTESAVLKPINIARPPSLVTCFVSIAFKSTLYASYFMNYFHLPSLDSSSSSDDGHRRCCMVRYTSISSPPLSTRWALDEMTTCEREPWSARQPAPGVAAGLH
jgi:hypothetical protein